MSSYETKSRDLVFEPDRTAIGTVSYRGSPSSTVYRSSITGRQRTTSRDNLRYYINRQLDKLRREGKLVDANRNAAEVALQQDSGGEFETTKHEYTGHRLEANIRHVNGYYLYTYDGPIFAYSDLVGPDSVVWPKPPTDLHDQMVAKGTTAIARTIPTNPAASTAQFLGELREGLPRLPGRSYVRRGGPGSIGDEYLNYEFGIKPFVSDLQSIWGAVDSAETRIRQLQRDSGKLVRRRYSFPVERTTSPEELVHSLWPGKPALRTGSTGAFPSVTGKLYRVRTTEVRTWFSGAYTYLYPKGDSALDRARRAASNLRATLGLDISPELLWELTPWSWAFDWISNMGDVMTNISRFSRDGLVMRYGYVMCTWKCTDTYTLVGQSWYGIGSPTLSQSFTTTVKKRVKATPYGFALDPDTFTTRQWAILGALGISRAQGLL